MNKLIFHKVIPLEVQDIKTLIAEYIEDEDYQPLRDKLITDYISLFASSINMMKCIELSSALKEVGIDKKKLPLDKVTEVIYQQVCALKSTSKDALDFKELSANTKEHYQRKATMCIYWF